MPADVEVPAPPTQAPPKEKERPVEQDTSVHLPQYHVVLFDDNDHTYDYVIEMLMQLFGHSGLKAFRMACEVDLIGRVVVDTTTKERADLKRSQIESYGPDWRLDHSKGSMAAAVEPAE